MTMPHANSGLAEALPYESDADKSDEEIAEGLMEITALSLTDLLADELPMHENLEKGYTVLAPSGVQSTKT